MTTIPESDTPFRVVPLARFAQGGRWRTAAMRSYSQPVLIWFTRGQGRITISGITRGYGAHNAVFIPANTMHGFEMSGQVFGSIVFFPKDADLDLPVEATHLRFREAQKQGELTAIIENLHRETDGTLPGQERALLHHGGLLSVWLERQISEQPEAELHHDASRRLAVAYAALVERDFRSGSSVTDYAALLGVTPTHLSRVCNTTNGRPASAIIADRVFFEARQMLRTSRTPIKDIAGQLGFASAAYFTRAFLKNTGKTPSGFRKQQ